MRLSSLCLLCITAVACLYAAVDPWIALGERRLTAAERFDHLPAIRALPAAERERFCQAMAAVISEPWDQRGENPGEAFGFDWQPPRSRNARDTMAARLALVEVLLAVAEGAGDESGPGTELSGDWLLPPMVVLVGQLDGWRTFLPHAWVGSGQPRGWEEWAARRRALRQRWYRAMARWPAHRLAAWCFRAWEDPLAPRLLPDAPAAFAAGGEVPTAWLYQPRARYYLPGLVTAPVPEEPIDVLLRVVWLQGQEHDLLAEIDALGLSAADRAVITEYAELAALSPTELVARLGAEALPDSAAGLRRWARWAGWLLTEPAPVAGDEAFLALPVLRAGIDTAALRQVLQAWQQQAVLVAEDDPAWLAAAVPLIAALDGPTGLRHYAIAFDQALRQRQGDAVATRLWLQACLMRPLLAVAMGRLTEAADLGELARGRYPEIRLDDLLEEAFECFARRPRDPAALRDFAWFLATSDLSAARSAWQDLRVPRYDISYEVAYSFAYFKDEERAWMLRFLQSLPATFGTRWLIAVVQSGSDRTAQLFNILAEEEERCDAATWQRLADAARRRAQAHLRHNHRPPSGLTPAGQRFFKRLVPSVPPATARQVEEFIDGSSRRQRVENLYAKVAANDRALADRFYAAIWKKNRMAAAAALAEAWNTAVPEAMATVIWAATDVERPTLLIDTGDWFHDYDWGRSSYWSRIDGLQKLHDALAPALPERGVGLLEPLFTLGLIRCARNKLERLDVWAERVAAMAPDDHLAPLWRQAIAQARCWYGQGDRATAAAIAAWYRQALAEAQSSERFLLAGRAALWQQRLAALGHGSVDCLTADQLLAIGRAVAAQWRAGAVWPSPAGDALLQAMLDADAQRPDVAAMQAELIDAGVDVEVVYDTYNGRWPRRRNCYLNAADDDGTRLYFCLCRAAVRRGDGEAMRRYLAVDENILLRSSGTYAELAISAMPASVVALFEQWWERIDREDYSMHWSPALAASLPPVLEAIADADQRFLFRCMMESLPSAPRPTEMVFDCLKAAERLVDDPARERRVDRLIVDFHQHDFADQQARWRCLWYLMGIGESNVRLRDVIRACARVYAPIGLPERGSPAWDQRMVYWSLQRALGDAVSAGEAEVFLEFLKASDGDPWPSGFARAVCGTLRSRAHAWSVTDWRRMAIAGRRLVDWQRAGHVAWDSSVIYWIVPVGIIAGDLDELAGWLAALPADMRKRVGGQKSLMKFLNDLADRTDCPIRPSLPARIGAYLDHVELQRLLPLASEQLEDCHRKGLIDAARYERELRQRCGQEAGAAWQRLADVLHAQEAWEAAIAALATAVDLADKKQRRRWGGDLGRWRKHQRDRDKRAAEEARRQAAAEQAAAEQAAAEPVSKNKSGEAQGAEGQADADQTQAELPSGLAPSAEGF